MQNIFSEVMEREEWQILLDFLFSYNEYPQLLTFFTASYILHRRDEFLQTRKPDQIPNMIYQVQNHTPVREVIDLAFRFLDP